MDYSNFYPWYVRIIFWLQKRKYGNGLNSALVWAKSPRIFLALSWLFGSLDRKNSPITATVRSLVIVRVSQINSCSFCIDLNMSVLMKRGVSMEKIESLSNWSSSNLFNAEEKIILEYTEAVTDSTKKIDSSIKEKIRTIFNEKELVELTALIAYQNMSTKFNNAFDIEPQGFCSIWMNGKTHK